MEQQSHDGHLCPAQQQPPREVPPARRGDTTDHTWHVPGWSSRVQSKELAEQGLLPGMDYFSATIIQR